MLATAVFLSFSILQAAIPQEDVSALLRECERNIEAMPKRMLDYGWTEKRTERRFDRRGEVTKETVAFYEVYPVSGTARPLRKLVSRNGVRLSEEQTAKELKRVASALEKMEREGRNNDEDRKQGRGKGFTLGILDFLRACQFTPVRRERFRDREAMVFDFRPRPDFRPEDFSQEVILNLVGRVWIDPVEKFVIRLQARPAQKNYPNADRLDDNPSLAFEVARLSDGVLIPSLMQVKTIGKARLFNGAETYFVIEWSDYKRFNTSIENYKIDPPKEKKP